MATLGDLKERIYREVHATLSVETQDCVMEAIAFYQPMRFWFNEAVATFVATLTTMHSLATAVPGAIAIDSLKALWAGSTYLLQRESHNDIEEWDTGNVSGTPSSYAIHHEMLRIYPKPSQTTTIEAAYHKQITLTSSNDATAVWTNEAADLIRHRAKALLYASVLRNDSAASIEQAMELQALSRLMSRTTKLTSSGRIKGYL